MYSRILLAVFMICALAPQAVAQWQTSNHSIPVGQGPGKTGFKSVGPCASNVPIVGAGASTDPACYSGALGTMSTQSSSSVSISGGAITGMPNPSAATDVATKQYVDNFASGVFFYASVNLASAAVLPNTPTYNNGTAGVGATLTAGSNSTLTVDGTVATLGMRVLVKDQASTFQNGVYTVTTAGSGSVPWEITRATDFNQSSNMVKGAQFYVTAGATNITLTYVSSTATTTVGTTPVIFFLAAGSGTTISGVGGPILLDNGLTMTGNKLNAPGMGLVTDVAFGAACDGTTDDSAAIQTALNSGFSPIVIPTGKVCIINSAAVSVPDNVVLMGPGTIKRGIVATHSATGGATVQQTVIPMTSSTLALVGTTAYDQTRGFVLPGVVASVSAGVSITMSQEVGNSTSGSTTATSLAASTILTFSGGPPALVIEGFGMTAYDLTTNQVLGGHVSAVGATTVTLSSPLGSNVGLGDTIQFGYPVANSDVIVFGTYSGALINMGNNSHLYNIYVDDSNFDGDPNQYAVGVFGKNDVVIEDVDFINTGLYALQYNNTNRLQVKYSRCTVNAPSNRNNNACILGFGNISVPGGVGTVITNNHFSGAAVVTSDFDLSFTNNEVTAYTGGASLFNVNSTIWSPATVTGNFLHDTGTAPDSNNTLPFGLGSLPPGSIIANNTITKMAGVGIECLGQASVITGNNIYDNGTGGTPRPGINADFIASNAYLNCSNSVITNNYSGGFNHATQAYGYQDAAGIVGITLLGNQFANNSVAPYLIVGTAYQSNDVPMPWTPALAFGTPVNPVSYDSRSGTYTKIGQMVNASFTINLNSKGTDTGTAKVTGWPAGGAITGLSIFPTGNCGSYTGMSGASGLTGLMANVSFTLTIPGAGAITNADNTNFGNSSTLNCTITYTSLN